MAETHLVPPDRVNDIWPYAADYLRAAVDRCGDWTLTDIRAELDRAYLQLWIVWDGSVAAAAVTELDNVPRGRVCRVVACGGHADWREAIKPIEQFAKNEGCTAMRIHGRAGWARLFRSYEIEWVALEKRLD